MGDKSGIEWTDATWNPIRGCSKVSEGCRNCYAEKVAARFSGEGMPYHGTIHDGRWSGSIRLVPEMLDQPLRWNRPRRIFVNSMSDLFHPGVPDEYIDQVFAVMALASHHTFQILTKRPERMLKYMTETDGYSDRLGCLSPYMESHGWVSPEDAANIAPPGSVLPKWPDWPLPNVWIGVSVENQRAADERIPLLLQTPATVRYLSCEPLLGPVDLERHLNGGKTIEEWKARALSGVDPYGFRPPYQRIHWVITGGESGPGARPSHPDWFRSLRDQCQAAGTAFFFKQWGEWAPFNMIDPRPQHPTKAIKMGNETIWRVGKKAAGRLLDGWEWNDFPEVR